MGETAPKKDYSWATYKYSNGDDYNNKFTKYCTDASDGYNGFIDNKTVLEPEDDAATVNWGEGWRMPTDAEWTELREQCTWTWTTQNGINGYQVTSKTNSNSIFLPAAGFRNGTSLYLLGTRGYYRSSSLLENYSDNVWIVTFNHEEVYRHSNNRNNGLSARPVQDKQEEEVESAYIPKPFTVAEGKQITFPGGNLQYTQSTDTWAFATQQTDYIGDANITTGTDGNKVLADKTDLFGWGTGNNPANLSANADDYQTFTDWGTNTIGTDAPDTWRTLTADEWFYIFFHRTNAEKLFSLATVNNVVGLVILPDDWTTPDGVAFTPSTDKGLPKGNTNYSGVDETDYRFTDNVYTAADWQKLEAAGAVFLSAAGERRKDTTVYVQEQKGYYWSATPETEGKWADSMAKIFYFSPRAVTPATVQNRYNGCPVRLVKNYSNVSTDITNPSATNTDEVRKVFRNGQVLILRNGKTYTLTGVEMK